MKIAHIASECAPWSQTGGLGQVVGALPDALVRHGATVAVFTPLYRSAAASLARAGIDLDRDAATVTVGIGGSDHRVTVHALVRSGRATVCFVDCPAMFDRSELYAEGGIDYPDNARRFALLCRAAIAASPEALAGPPDIVHGHDWQAGLAPAYLEGASTPTVLTIHNLGYQGVFHKSELQAVGLDWSHFTMQRFEYYDQLNLLKGGIAAADAVTTVSPQYSREIRTPEHGHGLDGFLLANGDKVSGILNGIDTDSWNPADDPALAAPYSADDPSSKATCRRALLDEFGLAAADDDPVIGIVSRMVEQKGLDLVADLVPELAELGARLVVLGSGNAGLEHRFELLAAHFSDRVAITVGFDLDLARRIYGGSDIVVVPSRFEPCGLTQMYAMRYGALPVVCSVGGLRDTVTDWGEAELAHGHGTGFRYDHPTAEGLRWALGRAVTMFRTDPGGWTTAVKHVMSRDLSWQLPAADYLALYRQLLDE